jgi:hypothetical protein
VVSDWSGDVSLGIYGGIDFGRRHCFARRRYALSTGENMTQTKIQTQNDAADDQPTIWSRAFEEIRRSRESGTPPNPEVFKDLTKSAGGD